MEIGTDIEQIKRFEGKSLDNDRAFLERLFTNNELDYCFSDTLSAQHLCGKFCAKEATIKALANFGITDATYKDIEILNKNKIPYIKLSKYPDYDIKVSISHSKDNAVAFVTADKIITAGGNL